jgi:hypothetical protein
VHIALSRPGTSAVSLEIILKREGRWIVPAALCVQNTLRGKSGDEAE